jgi:hypothetical protein
MKKIDRMKSTQRTKIKEEKILISYFVFIY